MSTLRDNNSVEQVMAAFPVGKVVRAFRTMGRMEWGLGRVMNVERHSQTDEPLGLLVQFFSDKVKIDYPLAILNLGEESFIVDVAHETVIREMWPIGTLAIAKMVGQEWMACHISEHTEYGLRLKLNIGETIFRWEDFTDDGRCAQLKRVGRRK